MEGQTNQEEDFSPQKKPLTQRQIILPFLIFGLLCLAAGGYFISLSTKTLDRQEIEQTVHLASSAISMEKENLGSLARDYSVWDETLRYVIDQLDHGWANTNIGQHLYDAFDIQKSYVVSADNKIIIAYANGEELTKSDTPRHIFSGISPLLMQTRSTDPLNPQPATGLLYNQGELFIVTASLIITEFPDADISHTRSRPVLVLARGLNEELLAKLEARYAFDELALTSLKVLNKRGSLTLHDPLGEILGAMHWKLSSPGKKLQRKLLPFSILTLFVMGGMVCLFLKRMGMFSAEKLASEEALKMSELRYRAIAEDSPVLICRFLADYKITYVNKAYSDYFSKTSNELLGRSFISLVSEEEQASLRNHLELLSYDSPTQSYECQVVGPNSETHWQRWTNRALFDEHNCIVAYQSVGEEITEQKQAEFELRRSEERYRGIFVSIKAVALLIDPEDMQIVDANQAAQCYYGYPIESLKKMKVSNLHTLSDNELFNEMEKSRTEQKNHFFFQHRLASGTIRDVEVHSGPVVIRDRQFIFSIIHDITDRNQMERVQKKEKQELEVAKDQLQKANEELKASQLTILQQEKMASVGVLAAGVAHEINNPIGFISSNLSSLGKFTKKLPEFINAQTRFIETVSSDSPQRAELDTLRRKLKIDYICEDIDDLISESQDGVERVTTIVKDLKRFSRNDSSDRKATRMEDCIESAINIAWNEIKYKATLHRHFAQDLPEIKCYPQQFIQVFLNLLINASHAIEEKGDITMRSWQENDSIKFSVSDTGCGIPKQNLSKLFEPFFTTKEPGNGTGLGLSISYDIVRKHGGEMTVDSEAGKGTTFTVHLPV